MHSGHCTVHSLNILSFDTHRAIAPDVRHNGQPKSTATTKGCSWLSRLMALLRIRTDHATPTAPVDVRHRLREGPYVAADVPDGVLALPIRKHLRIAEDAGAGCFCMMLIVGQG